MISARLACMAAAVLSLQGQPTFEEQASTALQAAGLTTDTARFDENLLLLFRQGEFTPPIYQAASDNPWRMPLFAEAASREIAASSGKMNEVLSLGTRWAGIGSRRTLIGNPIQTAIEAAQKPEALRVALERLLKESGAPASPPVDLGSVPASAQKAAALMLLVCLDAKATHRAAFARISPAQLSAHFAEWAKSGPSEDTESFNRSLDLFRSLDAKYLVAGGHDLALAATQASAWAAEVPPTASYDVRVVTPWGEVRLTGGASNRHGEFRGLRAEPPILLVVDTGGDDVYVNAPSNQSLANWVSLVIDTAGNDRYVSDAPLETTPVEKYARRKDVTTPCGPAGALFGYAILVDLAGNDLYRSHRPGIASGRLGVAVLHDAGGDDVYDGYQDSLGFGMFGAGLLEDVQGHDGYAGFVQTQGVGQTFGFGAIVDRSGNDRYIANDIVIDFPSPQSAQHNANMSQGAGNGHRRDYIDGHSLAGGFGLLWDGAGDDEYAGGVFVQGVGYWESVGILWDQAGNDRYSGAWYAQGASAHFAVGYLEDVAGDDVYVATMNMAQGAGHDFGPGFLIDRAGNDKYQAPNLSLGAGNANGIGIFLDQSGDDVYSSSGLTLGKSGESPSGSLRMRGLALGVFLDLQGRDTYPEAASWAKNGAATVNWTARGRTPAESQLGVFQDR